MSCCRFRISKLRRVLKDIQLSLSCNFVLYVISTPFHLEFHNCKYQHLYLFIATISDLDFTSLKTKRLMNEKNLKEIYGPVPEFS